MRTIVAIATALFVMGCAVQPQSSGYVGTSATAQKEGTAYYKDKPGQQLSQRGGGAFRVSR